MSPRTDSVREGFLICAGLSAEQSVTANSRGPALLLEADHNERRARFLVGLSFFPLSHAKRGEGLSVERMNYNGGNNALAVTSSITRFIAAHGLHFINRLTEVS